MWDSNRVLKCVCGFFWIGRKRERVEGLKMGLNLRWGLGEIAGGVRIVAFGNVGFGILESEVREKQEIAIEEVEN